MIYRKNFLLENSGVFSIVSTSVQKVYNYFFPVFLIYKLCQYTVELNELKLKTKQRNVSQSVIYLLY